MNTIGCYKSHYSLGRSVLTLEPEGKSKPTEPDSIIDIAIEEKLKEVVLVEDTISGYLQAYKNFKDVEIKLIFGLRLTVTPDMTEKTDASLKKDAKYVIFARNTEGYKRLIKISTKASCDGFYYQPRIDFKTLKELWNEEDLKISVPFYDSFLAQNTLTTSLCIPDFSFAKPTFFIEDNELFIDELITPKIQGYCKENDYEMINTKSIYYKTRKDFKNYCVFRCIHNRSTLNKPEISGLTSKEFCLESLKERMK